jgi:hypothetical protein
MMEEVNSTMINCKNFCKCHNVSPSETIIKKYINKLIKLKKIPKKPSGTGVSIGGKMDSILSKGLFRVSISTLVSLIKSSVTEWLEVAQF